VAKSREFPAPNVTTLRLTQLGDDRRVKGRTVLRQAREQRLDEVLVIGRTGDGELWASSSLNAGQSLWLIEKLKERVLAGNPWSIV
jgi:hypothetical protein